MNSRAVVFVAVLAVGCGGRASGSSGGAGASGSGAGASVSASGTGMASGSAGAATGAMSGGTGPAGSESAGAITAPGTTGTLDGGPGGCTSLGRTMCFGVCVFEQEDPTNCGACGTECQAGATCQSGVCCPSGLTACDLLSGPAVMAACFDEQNDSNNCGGCRVMCPTGQLCQSGTCVSCPSGEIANDPSDVPAEEAESGFRACLKSCSPVDASSDGMIGVGGDECAEPPSCQPGGPGTTNCGVSILSESCCTSLGVLGGTFYRTYERLAADGGALGADGGPIGEADPATASAFRLDKYLVTVGRFRQFVSAVLPSDGGARWLPSVGAGKHTHLNGGNGLAATGGGYEPGWLASDDSNIAPTNANLASCAPYSTWTASAGSQENLPIDCVNWYEAYAFCIWDGGFLPSEAEWEYAAAGGNQQREYPWGSWDPGTESDYAVYGCYYPSGSGICAGTANIAPLGTALGGWGRWGQLDLAGEIFEWSLDSFAPYVDPCEDCANVTALAGVSTRVFRGGAFNSKVSLLLPAYRDNALAAARLPGVGFRCARSP
jgi:sulfatase modifying factor 1